MAAVRCNVVI